MLDSSVDSSSPTSKHLTDAQFNILMHTFGKHIKEFNKNTQPASEGS